MAGTFSADLSRLCRKANADVTTVVRKIAFETFKRVILRTPVDTGRARANWSVTIGKPSQFTTYGRMNKKGEERFDKGGGQAINEAMDGVNGWSVNGSIFMANNLPYILPLEFGHSKQAPSGMVRVTLTEIQAWLESTGNAKQTFTDIRNRE